MNLEVKQNRDPQFKVFQEWVGIRMQKPNYSSITFTKDKGISIQEFVSIIRAYQKGVFHFLL